MPDPQTATLQQRIALFARSKKGRTVGGGECTDFVEAALREGGGMMLFDLKQSDAQTKKRDQDYVWGDPVAIKDARPGDILQFKDHAVEIDIAVTATFPDGTKVENAEGSETSTETRGHHSALVESVEGGGTLKTLEQNTASDGRVVAAKTLPTAGTVTTTRTTKMMRRPDTGKLESASVTTVTTVTVEGTVRVYRARAK